MYKFSNLTQEIPKNSKVCLYCSTDLSVFYKKLLELKRPDVEIICFLDSFKESLADGLKINRLADFLASKIDYDYIVVTSFHSSVSETLLNFGADLNKIIYIDLTKYQDLHDYYKKFSIFSEIRHVSEEKWEQNKDFYLKARELFLKEEDKNLYDLIVNAWRKETEFSKLTDYMLKNTEKIPYQYLEFANKNAVKTALEGGSFTGSTSVMFMNNFPNLENLIIFDPMYKDFLLEPYSSILQNSEKVSLNAYGLWDCKTQLNFRKNTISLGASCIISGDCDEEPYCSINTTCIDNFVEEKNITSKIDFIKFDIEGAEKEALKGAEKTLVKNRPQLAICLYHRADDLFEIPLYLNSVLKNYVFRLGHYRINTGETVLYAIPAEIYTD